MNQSSLTALALVFLGLIAPRAICANPVLSWEKQADGVTFRLRPGVLKLQVCAPRIVRVRYGPGAALPRHHSLSVIARFRPTPWRLQADAQTVTVRTAQLQAQVSRATGAVRFLDVRGRPILSETPDGRTLTRTVLAGTPPEPAFQSGQRFVMPPDEDVFGLGQHQDGAMGYRGYRVTLEQANREVAIPFLVSSRGYGLLWDNPAHTEVSVGAGDAVPIPAAAFTTEDGKPGGLTGRYFQGQEFQTLIATRTDPRVNFDWTDAPPPGLGHDNYSVRWTGSVRAGRGGDYTFVTTSDDGARLWVDGKQVIDYWNTGPVRTSQAVVRFAAGTRHRLRLDYAQKDGQAIMKLAWRQPGQSSTLDWTSEAAEGIDYYFVYGPALDSVIASYRAMTGTAPMPPRWALGFWQSKGKYVSQQEWLGVAAEYRRRREPIDALVQDWSYSGPYPWGSHKFDERFWPHPSAAVAALHSQYKLHFMISVWGKFDPGSPNNPNANYDVLNASGYLYPPLGERPRFYDAFNPAARALYWDLMRGELSPLGVDAWWLDASEPEVQMGPFRQVQTAQGRAARVLNAWPLMHTQAVYQGQRAAAPNKRVFLLTRSAFAGQQRNAAAVWSGDLVASWGVFAHQIPAGLNFCLSGIPYWTTDIGGFFVDPPFGPDDPAYRELFTRWFQWGAFCPMFRTHGTDTPKELWRFGPKYEPILAKYDRLRYRLLPYLYSQAWQVTGHGGTIMRALVMDFPQDVTARRSADEFLFGPSLLVCPVTQPGAASRRVYLPKGARWTDFWTGHNSAGGQTLTAPAPIQTMPLYVRAGSLLPLGPIVERAAQSAQAPIELRVYRGANGAFTLYEDQGDGYNYEKGVYATVPLTWNEATQTLTLGARSGRFPGMAMRRTFRIVWVRPGHGSGFEPSAPDRVVIFAGRKITIKLKESSCRH